MHTSSALTAIVYTNKCPGCMTRQSAVHIHRAHAAVSLTVLCLSLHGSMLCRSGHCLVLCNLLEHQPCRSVVFVSPPPSYVPSFLAISTAAAATVKPGKMLTYSSLLKSGKWQLQPPVSTSPSVHGCCRHFLWACALVTPHGSCGGPPACKRQARDDQDLLPHVLALHPIRHCRLSIRVSPALSASASSGLHPVQALCGC